MAPPTQTRLAPPVARMVRPRPCEPARVARRSSPAVTPRDVCDPLAPLLARSVQQRALEGPLLQRDFLDELGDWLRDSATINTVRVLIGVGVSDENTLTNAAFFFVHPEMTGVKLRPKEVPAHKPLAAQWVQLRDKLVRPELTKASTPKPAPAEEPSEPTPAPKAGGKVISKQFLAEHRELLEQLHATDDELLMLLDSTIAQGSTNVRVEYTSHSKAKTPTPLTQLLFMKRNPGVNVVAKLGATPLKDWQKKAGAAGGWDNLGVTEQQWVEIAGIRDKIIYPFLRIVLPRIEAPDALPADATAGERIAHKAHAYLGVRYKVGGHYKGSDPWGADPSKEGASTLDCLWFVFTVHSDVGLPITAGAGDMVRKKDLAIEKLDKEAIKQATHYKVDGYVDELKNSANLMEVSKEDRQPGDLLLRLRPSEDKTAIEGMHVGIYIGHDELIEAPSTGRVVCKTPYLDNKWLWVRRRRPKS